MADDAMDGGGLHRSLAGGFLNVHADFTAHHSKPQWRRRVNLLLYLNPDLGPELGRRSCSCGRRTCSAP